MSKKQPTQEELADKVFVGNFSNDTDEQSILTPQDGDKLILQHSQITPYDKNPRRVRNREYESIKEQLLAQGLKEVMSVTQRPGMPINQFMPARGFNTRLQIILEIFEQTGDERFAQIECRYQAWESEAKTFTNHMAENEVRGEVTFFDRANSVMTLQSILEEETGNPYGPRELIDYLKSQGIRKASRKDIARFKYTIGHLQDSLLETLSQGLGPRQIDAISKLHEASSRLWEDAGESEDWDPLFQGILKKLDQRIERLEDWSYDRLFKEVARELGGNDTQGIERMLASLEFVLETGRLPEKRDYEPITVDPGQGKQGDKSKPKSKPKPSSQTPKQPVEQAQIQTVNSTTSTTGQEAGSSEDQGKSLDLLFENEEDPNDALIDLEQDSLLRELAPDPGLLEGEDGSLHYQPDHSRYDTTPGALEANLEAYRRMRERQKLNPPEPLPPEVQELIERRLAWEADLERNRVEAGRTRATEMRMLRLMENYKALDLEVVHHHGYASALRMCREVLKSEDLIRPINCGVGFYVHDFPDALDFHNNGHDAYIRLSAWYWLVTASGQSKILRSEQLPQEILDAPFGAVIADALNEEGMVEYQRLTQAFASRLTAEPSLLMLQELMVITSLNLSVDQAILTRVICEVMSRSLNQLTDGATPGAIFQLESRWDRQYSDQLIDKNDYR